MILGHKPLIMGIVNVTPDSFSGDGIYKDRQQLIDQVGAFIEDGADVIDLGGESTRPGAVPVEEKEEYDRVVPAIELIKKHFSTTKLSVDTSKTSIIAKAVALEVDMINDVRSLSSSQALEAAVPGHASVVINHMQGDPLSMQNAPHYDDVVAQVLAYFQERIAAYVQAGIARERIWLDPGFGFGKNQVHNYKLLGQLSQFKSLGCPLLVGLSRKRMIKQVVGENELSLMVGSVSANLLAIHFGASMVRVHDVAMMRASLNVLQEID